jgi:hypothetical protein
MKERLHGRPGALKVRRTYVHTPSKTCDMGGGYNYGQCRTTYSVVNALTGFLMRMGRFGQNMRDCHTSSG